MKDRVIGGIFVILMTLIMLLPGGIVSAVVLAVISSIGIYELYRVYSLEKTVLAGLAYAETIIFYGLLYFEQEYFLPPFILAVLMILLVIYVIMFPKYKDKDVEKAFFGFIYLTVMLSYVYRLRSLEAGLMLSFFILISTWGNDVFAYLVGSAIGKHQFSPKVSPNKSIEGFIGGILGAAFVSYIYAFFLKDNIPFRPIYCAVIAALGAIPAVIGDLAASAIKRDNEIKDYGHLIPGHGGIVDRFDSVIFTAPIIYYLVELFNVI